MNAPARNAEAAALASFADRAWDERIVPALTDYIAVPAKSPMFDADWVANGYLDRVVRDAAAWVESRKVPGLTLEVVRLEGRTPVILFEVPASGRAAGASAVGLARVGDSSRGWLAGAGACLQSPPLARTCTRARPQDQCTQ